ncbi:MAG: hypothetical protein AABY15_05880 [Nanoarchaeota archaeon]
MKTWKIKNITENPVKLSIALGGQNNPGIILNPGEMVLSVDRLTAPLDAQERRGVIKVDRDFNNSELKLPLGTVMIDIDEAIKNVEGYSEK